LSHLGSTTTAAGHGRHRYLDEFTGRNATRDEVLAHCDEQLRRVGIECQDIEVLSMTRLRRLLELNAGDADRMNRELSYLFARP